MCPTPMPLWGRGSSTGPTRWPEVRSRKAAPPIAASNCKPRSISDGHELRNRKCEEKGGNKRKRKTEPQRAGKRAGAKNVGTARPRQSFDRRLECSLKETARLPRRG